MTLERPNLADAFAATKRPAVDRAAGLSGLLPPARPKQVPIPNETSAVPAVADTTPMAPVIGDAAPSAAVVAAPARTTRATRAEKRVPVSETADTVANVAVYLEPDLLELAKTQRRATGITYDELVVRAFAGVPDQDIQAVLRPAVEPLPAAGMPARQRRLRGTAGIQIQLRLTGPQRAWLDTKREALGAPSRSALVATALRLYLAN